MEDKYEKAIENLIDLEKAIKMLEDIADEDDRACFMLYTIYIDLKEYDKAEIYLDKSCNNENVKSIYNYAIFLIEVKKEIQKAQKISEKLKDKNLGLYYFLRAKITNSKEDYILAYENGVNAAALIVAALFEKEDNIEMAIKYYKLSDDYISHESISKLSKNEILEEKSSKNRITEYLKKLFKYKN